MKHNNELDQLKERHRGFWEMAEVDLPLTSIGTYKPLQPRQPFSLADGSQTQEGMVISPELVDAQRLVGGGRGPADVIGGDFIRGTAPYDLCWNEAFAGCPISWRNGLVRTVF